MELIEAVLLNDAEQVKKALQEGADPNFCDDKAKITPLHFAAQNNSLAVVPLLIAAGANLHAKTVPEGSTPLDIAKLHQHKKMIELLTFFIVNSNNC